MRAKPGTLKGAGVGEWLRDIQTLKKVGECASLHRSEWVRNLHTRKAVGACETPAQTLKGVSVCETANPKRSGWVGGWVRNPEL